MRNKFLPAAALPAALALALLGTPVLAQNANQQPQPNLSSDVLKPQQNSADEAAVRAKMEDGIKPGDVNAQSEAAKKVEDAAVEAKRKSDAKDGTTGTGVKQ